MSKEKEKFLESYIVLQERIDNLLKEKNKWIARRSSLGGGGSDGIHTQNNTSRVEFTAVKIADIVDSINDDIERCISAREQVRKAISGLDNERHKLLLEMRYLNDISNYNIALELGKDVRTIYKVMEKAIDKIEVPPSF